MTPPRVFSWKPFQSIQNTYASKILEIITFSAKGDFCRCLTFAFMKSVFPKFIFFSQLPGFACNNILISMVRDVNSSYS